MRESLLHYLWRTRTFDARGLATTQQLPIEILYPGEQNPHAGPDFFNARLRIGDTLWAGNVEMHVRASEWYAHGHQEDPAYDNVILHVVHTNDKPIYTTKGQLLPCLELRDRIPDGVLRQYRRLETEIAPVPCHDGLPLVPVFRMRHWLDRLLVERLEQKTTVVAETYAATGNNWEETFYRRLAFSFGLKINAEPFEALARRLPLALVAKHRNHLFQLEALVFGQAGFLEQPAVEEYPLQLAREYRHLRHKYQLEPLEASIWKFLRLRPANFPTVRLAQFAALLHQSEHLFSRMLDLPQGHERWQDLFAGVDVSEYWQSHFHFGKKTAPGPRRLGHKTMDILLANCLVPMLFFYGKHRQSEVYQEYALRLLEQAPAESNAQLDLWHGLGFKPANAFESQALLQLHTQYCARRRCLECAVGHQILQG